jgi:hypothetical protein
MVAQGEQTASTSSRRRVAPSSGLPFQYNYTTSSDSRISSSTSSSNSLTSTLSCTVNNKQNCNSIQPLPMSLTSPSKHHVQNQSTTSTNLFYGTRASLRNRTSSDASWLSSSDDEDTSDDDGENDLLPAIRRSIFECEVLGLDSLSVHSISSTASGSYRNGCQRCSSNDNLTPLALYNDFVDDSENDNDNNDDDDVDDVSVLYCDGKVNSTTVPVSSTTTTITSSSDNDTTTTYAETSYSRDSSVVSFCINPPKVFNYDKPEFTYYSDLYYDSSEMEQMMEEYIYEQNNVNNNNNIGKEFRE